MTITATPNHRESYVETGCSAADLIWPDEKAARFRDLVIEAIGRDCVCEPGGTCYLYRGHVELRRLQAVEDGLVTAFAAVQRDANDASREGGGPAAATVYEVATDHGLNGARVVGRVAAASR